MALPVNLSELYIGFGVANRNHRNPTSDRAVRRLWYKHLDYSGGQSIWSILVTIPACGLELPYEGPFSIVCGNVGCCSMASDTGGPCSPRVRHAHPVQRSLKQPIIDGRSLATPLLPGNPSGLCFNLARLWNRSVFRVGVPLQRDGCTCQRAGIISECYLS